VVNFIRSRCAEQNLNERVHAIWYCLTTNSRPIQQSEEMFFSVKHGVPIVAIFTKFDLFVEDQLQELMEKANYSNNLNEEELENKATKTALEKFEKHYKEELLKKPCPPQAVVAVSNVHTSKPTDSRLSELINATLKALKVATDKSDIRAKFDRSRLRTLFATAQKADLASKYEPSLFFGMPQYITGSYKRNLVASVRGVLIHVWNTSWIDNPKLILSAFDSHVEKHPKTLGNKSSLKYSKMRKLTSIEQEACRCAQLASDLTVIMAEIFILDVKDVDTAKKIVQSYPTTPAFSFIQDQVLDLNWSSVYDQERGSTNIVKLLWDIKTIIGQAVQLNSGST